MALVWAPHVIENLKDFELSLYLEFSSSACIPSGACNIDRALQVLYQSDGDIKLALERLLTNDAQISIHHDNHTIWTEDERQCFERLFKFHGKNFSQISLSMKTKSVKQCVEFYYIWKKSTFRNILVSPRSTRATLATEEVTTTHPITPHDTDHNNNSNDNNNNNSSNNSNDINGNILGQEQFPCKVCGRVFVKIKSRSAHMKRHKNER